MSQAVVPGNFNMSRASFVDGISVGGLSFFFLAAQQSATCSTRRGFPSAPAGSRSSTYRGPVAGDGSRGTWS